MEIPNRKYIITISYGNYRGSMGGTDKYIAELQKLLQSFGISLVHLFPLKKRIKNIVITTKLWGVLVDGCFDGYHTTAAIINFVYSQNANHHLINVYINHLKDCSINNVCVLLDHIIAPITFFIHDFFSICSTGGLIRNNNTFCGTEYPSREKCEGCVYYSKYNIKRIEAYKKLFDRYSERINFVAPSIGCAKNWKAAYKNISKKVTVIPHQNLVGKYTDNMEYIDDMEPVKIAFIGMQRELKGWKEWLDACRKIGNNPLIKLYHFGGKNENINNVKHVDINFNNENESMTNQLRKEKIQCAVLWSKIPETYSYTYYEVFASNCFVLTNNCSGNIADQIKLNENGYICSNVDGLKDIISNEKRIRTLINDFRKQKKYGPEYLKINPNIIKLLDNPVLNKNVIKRVPRILEFRSVGNLTTQLYIIIKNKKKES